MEPLLASRYETGYVVLILVLVYGLPAIGFVGVVAAVFFVLKGWKRRPSDDMPKNKRDPSPPR